MNPIKQRCKRTYQIMTSCTEVFGNRKGIQKGEQQQVFVISELILRTTKLRAQSEWLYRRKRKETQQFARSGITHRG